MSSNSRRLAMPLAFLCCALLAGALCASTFVALDSRGMVENSDRVVQGRIVAMESFWNEDGRVIVTEAQIAVSETLVGGHLETVTVRTPGGKVGDLRIEASGFPTFQNNDEVILFLEDTDAGYQRVVGHQQGHFEVVERLDGVRLAVPQIEEGTRLYTRSGNRLPAARSTELGQFKNNVRGLAARAGRIVN